MGDQIRRTLEAFWEAQAISLDGESTSVDELVAAMDSMTAVEALVEVEKIVGMELPSGDVIRRGGYESKKQFVEELTARVFSYVKEHKK
jgi:hypothetical protein